MSAMEETKVRCDLWLADCVCREQADHAGPHVCTCGGSWETVDGELVIRAWPASNPEWVVPS